MVAFSDTEHACVASARRYSKEVVACAIAIRAGVLDVDVDVEVVVVMVVVADADASCGL